MEEKKISSSVLSRATKIPKSTISSYLSGKKSAYSPDHLLAMASYLQVSVDYLLSGTESDYALLNTLKTEGLFEGWLKVKIERAVPTKKGNLK